jgi:hypothetical protein
MAILVLGSLSAHANSLPPVKRVEMRAEGLYVNGKPFFPIGIGWAGHWHYSMPEASAMGFNMVVTHGLRTNPASFRMDIEDAWANGMYSACSIGNDVWKDVELLEKIILDCRDHPGLLVWELVDEPNHPNNPYRYPPEQLKPTYDLVKRLDPGRPVWLNLAVGRLKDHQDYAHVADIHSDNTYPVPVASVTSVAKYSDSVIKGSGKLGWMWIQMCPLRDPPNNRHPTITEVRCMTYMAAAHAISGVLYFSFHYMGEKDDHWTWWVTDDPAECAQWADLTAELKLLTPYLVTPQVPGELKAESMEGSETPATELHLSLRQTESGYFLIAVNGATSPIKARFTLPVPESGFAPQAAVRSENRLVTVTDGVFEDAFAPLEVHLYELPYSIEDAPDRNTIDWPRWQRRPRR